MSMTKSRALFALSSLALGLSLSACDGIGSGNELVSMHIVPAEVTNTTVEAIRQTYTDVSATECVRRQVTLIGQFSKNDNSLGTFTDRAKWTSSNPAVARVSDLTEEGREPLPTDPNSFFGSGVITPVSTGTAVITAKYLDFTSTIKVTVKPIVDVRIEPANPRLAVGSTSGFRLTAELNGVRQDIASSNAVMSFSPADDTIAVATGNAVSARNPGGPLNLQFVLPTCTRTITTPVRVAEVQSLVIQHPAGFSGDLVVNNSETPVVYADFGDGPEQNVTGNSAVTLVTSTDSTRVALSAITKSLVALVAGDPVKIQATCCTGDRNGDGDSVDDGETAPVTSPEFSVRPVAGTLTSIALSPLNASIVQRGSQVYTVTGTFDSSGVSIVQPLNAGLGLASSDTAVVAFSSGSATAVSLTEVTEPKTVTITSTPTFTGSTAAAVTTNLTVTPAP